RPDVEAYEPSNISAARPEGRLSAAGVSVRSDRRPRGVTLLPNGSDNYSSSHQTIGRLAGGYGRTDRALAGPHRPRATGESQGERTLAVIHAAGRGDPGPPGSLVAQGL